MSLIRYYRNILIDIIPDSVLVNDLSELLDLSEKGFNARLQRETRMALGEHAEPPGQDLIPAASVSRLLTLLNDILSVALIVTGDDREKDIHKVIILIISFIIYQN